MKSTLLRVAAAAAVGAVAVLITAGRTWANATAPGASHQHVAVTGHQLASGLSALSLALLALAVAVLAATGVMRRLAGLVGVMTSGALIAVVVRAHDDVRTGLGARAFGVPARSLPVHEAGWWVVALCGAAVATLAFATVVVVGGRWRGMGARYDAPRSSTRRADPAVSAWDALDRGDDPTA